MLFWDILGIAVGVEVEEPRAVGLRGAWCPCVADGLGYPVYLFLGD